MRTITINWSNWGNYRQLYRVVEWREGAIYKTKPLGYVSWSYQPAENELVTPLSTTLIGKTIEYTL